MSFTSMREELQKLASGDTTEIEATPQTKDDMTANTKVLAELFESRDGLAQNVKKDLHNLFNTSDPRYTMRKQTLIEKTAAVLRSIKR